MNKTYYLITTIFFTLIITALAEGCSTVFSNKKTETVTFILPEWPPVYTLRSESAASDSLKTEASEYPELSRWYIQIAGPAVCSVSDKSSLVDETALSDSLLIREFYTTASEIVLEIEKNVPFSITAAPVTVLNLSDNQNCTAETKQELTEALFFRPAGALYPCTLDTEAMTEELNWEEGFSAAMMQQIYKSTMETEISKESITSFNSSFNWKKLQETINKKTEEYYSESESESTCFFNPWQIDSENLLNNLCYAAFSANLITVKNSFNVSLDDINLSDYSKVFSSYVPENEILQDKGLVCVQKNTPELLLYDHIYAAMITAASSKKVSVDFTYMPILCKSYENSD